MKIRDFFKDKAWKKWDKSQWMILLLTGVLLMILAIPTGDRKKEEYHTDNKDICSCHNWNHIGILC